MTTYDRRDDFGGIHDLFDNPDFDDEWGDNSEWDDWTGPEHTREFPVTAPSHGATRETPFGHHSSHPRALPTPPAQAYAPEGEHAPQPSYQPRRGTHGTSRIVHIMAFLTLLIGQLSLVTVILAIRSIIKGYRGWKLCLIYTILFAPSATLTALRMLHGAFF